MKRLIVQNEQFEAEHIVKTDSEIIGYNCGNIVFKFSGIGNFNSYVLADGQEFDAPILMAEERIAELEQVINLILIGGI